VELEFTPFWVESIQKGLLSKDTSATWVGNARGMAGG
jgi:hypothetical protein